MMSTRQIEEDSRRAARRAAREHKKPFLFEEEDRGKMDHLKIPNIGDYRPKGWELVGTLFVDSSGWGSPGEPALTQDQFMNRMKAGMGYAVIKAGEFQVYVGEFKKLMTYRKDKEGVEHWNE